MASSSRAIDHSPVEPGASSSNNQRSRWNPLGGQQSTEPTPYHLPPQSTVSPNNGMGEKALARAIMQQGRSAALDHRDAPSSPIASGNDAEGFSSRSAEHLVDYDSSGRGTSNRYPKGKSFKRHSKATRYRWGFFFSHILLCFVIFGLSAQIHEKLELKQRSDLDPSQSVLPSDAFIRLKFWKAFPFVSAGTGLIAIMLLWILDAYYPLTLLSRPRGQVFFLMAVMTFQGGLTVGWCFVTPFAIDAVSRTTTFWEFPRIFILSWTVAGCMLTQIFLLTAVCLIIIFSTSKHIRAGRRDALYHPLCRYDPAAPRAIDMLSKSHVAPSFVGGSTSIIGTTTFGSTAVGMQRLRSANALGDREPPTATRTNTLSEPQRRDTHPTIPSPLATNAPPLPQSNG